MEFSLSYLFNFSLHKKIKTHKETLSNSGTIPNAAKITSFNIETLTTIQKVGCLNLSSSMCSRRHNNGTVCSQFSQKIANSCETGQIFLLIIRTQKTHNSMFLLLFSMECGMLTINASAFHSMCRI